MRFETKELTEDYDYLAPDGSEIRLLPAMKRGAIPFAPILMAA